MKLRILQLTKKTPFPLRDGESIAISYLSKALSELGCELTLLTMDTTKHPVDHQAILNNCPQYKEVHIISVDNRIKYWDAFTNIFTKDSYHISRFISVNYKKKIIQLLTENTYDIIQLETLYLAPYIHIIRKHSKAKVCMRSHNIEHEIWERVASNSSNPFKKLYLKHLTRKLKQYEIDKLDKYDFLISVSERDLRKLKELGYRKEGVASPIGIHLEKYRRSILVKTAPSICFIGALDWIPNIEGLHWFLEKVWPMLSTRNPHLKLNIAGRNIGDEFVKLNADNVIVHGEVPDGADFINNHDIMVVPLLSGSGTRVKILEAMSLGKGIVTTSIGKEGIGAIDKKHLFVADTPIDFIHAIETLVIDGYLLRNMGREAQDFVSNHYNYLDNAQKLIDNYQQILS